ncbi:MAG: UTP--glucose-1-phosphate uridylyltransferase [Microthrixaceae bacterium]|nr:UTP--glucose-1-phosphate uridylyltransferase [Microthrixaceae bacterium]
MEEAVAAGIDDILNITGRNKRSLEDHFDRNFELEYMLEAKGKVDELGEVVNLADLADIHFVRQGEPLGLGHAVSVARKHVGDHPFVVMLGDDIMTHRPPLISEMMDLHASTGGSVIALKEVPHEDISLYGCAEPGDRDGNVVEFRGVVEKPAPEDAPSDLAVVGRYLFTPRIFEFLDDAQPGVGGEIQLTDAMDRLLGVEPMHGMVFDSGRYDIGKKLDFLRATVELTLERDDLGPEFSTFLAKLVAERGLM